MKRPVFCLLFLILLASTAIAQRGELYIKSDEKGLYLEHKTAPKENFFSIGRMYTVHPKFIAAYNKLDMNKGLAIGQVIRIPLTDTNFTQKGNSGVPLYYKTREGEGLMKVSKLHHDVTLETIRNWNGLSENTVRPGTSLVVGFLVSKEIPSVTLNSKGQTKIEEPKKVVDLPAKKEEPVTLKTELPATKKDPELTKPVEVVEKKEPAPVEVKEEHKAAPAPVVAKKEENIPNSPNGYFKYHFEQQVKHTPARKEETVTSGIFKTTSGWVDGKYYMLMDNVQPGTIIKITNPANNKFIFAKVLGELSSIKQNDGLNIRISSAGASVLQISEEDKFIVKVNY